MLSEERQSLILDRLRTKRAVTVQELVQDLDSSAATIRRDLTELHNKGLLQKVHGGAVSCDVDYFTTEPDMNTKANLFTDEKEAIAREAASLIEDHDFVFIDAGTTTERILPYVKAQNVTFVTNGTSHAAFLAARHGRVILLGGQVKAVTGAIIGDTALQQLDVFNFTKGFFGANGVSVKGGYSTPDPAEAAIKTKAMHHCHHAYVLCDSSKFDKISPITFAPLESATIITTHVKGAYSSYTEVREVLP
ncbi:DeoR/GlpR family DNA-binding transcription regulator [Veillonella criceti]|uniref:Lactose phosphotransferase system repressor n=1 Tax=Veillonella criceti TaxID=103891 RepID=A0A380NM99_9FIRM|nr:DeoR/GlpR family DNA-binding transcription regulator [Veillonella criceti]SUP44249.1 Lactose phosphotransferase system repressor [Veillonella criceti]